MLVRAISILLVAASLQAAVPTPQSHFGHEIGADRTVLDWDKVVSYFRELEKSSPRIRVQELGKTTEGRPMITAIISSPETLQNLNRYIEIQKKLADPRLTPRAEAEALIAKGKAVVLITCSIHSTELASTHTAVEFKRIRAGAPSRSKAAKFTLFRQMFSSDRSPAIASGIIVLTMSLAIPLLPSGNICDSLSANPPNPSNA
jgi:hypothetical protein